MSAQKAALRTVTERINARDIDGLESLFSQDFILHDPSAPHWPRGHAGARQMLRSIVELGPDLVLQALDMIEEGDRVTVRWHFEWTYMDTPQRAAVVAIYRFENGLIAEDWGVSARAGWP
jgi:predicted SnoaL-like aldol condensation-catalyzing enzyme